jgi:hypothetical protein
MLTAGVGAYLSDGENRKELLTGTERKHPHEH